MAKKKEKKAGKRMKKSEMSERLISLFHTKQKIEILRFALKTNAVNKKAKDLNMTILMGITNVQDRTIFLESNLDRKSVV